jgi:phage baseplate assembly protein V
MQTAIRRLYQRTMAMVGRGRITTVDDSGPVQLVQVDLGPKGENGSLQVRDKTPVLALFGLASNPPAKTDAILLSLGGDLNKSVIIGHGHQTYRLKNLGAGDVALYDVRGAYAWFKPGGLVIDAAGGNVTIQNAAAVTVTASGDCTVNAAAATVNAPTTINGDLTVNGAVAATGDVTAGAVSLKEHVHGGVTAGAADTTPPL